MLTSLVILLFVVVMLLVAATVIVLLTRGGASVRVANLTGGVTAAVGMVPVVILGIGGCDAVCWLYWLGLWSWWDCLEVGCWCGPMFPG